MFLSSLDEDTHYDEPGFSHSCLYAPRNGKYRVVSRSTQKQSLAERKENFVIPFEVKLFV